MPVYEFYCPDCHTIFNFFARSVNITKRPMCPRCKKRRLKRQVSMFSATGKHGDAGEEGDLPFDESKMERAMEQLAGEAEHISEDDPRQAAQLMRKFSKMTGMEFGGSMEEALSRIEAGEDPDTVEAEMGEKLEADEDAILMPGKKPGVKARRKLKPPNRDENLYDL